MRCRVFPICYRQETHDKGQMAQRHDRSGREELESLVIVFVNWHQVILSPFVKLSDLTSESYYYIKRLSDLKQIQTRNWQMQQDKSVTLYHEEVQTKVKNLKQKYKQLEFLQSQLKSLKAKDNKTLEEKHQQEQRQREKRRKLYERDRQMHQLFLDQQQKQRERQKEDRIKKRVHQSLEKIRINKMQRESSQNSRFRQINFQKKQNLSPFHIRKLEEDKQRQKQQQERKKQILSQRRQIYKSLNFQDIKSHQKDYEKLSQNLSLSKKREREYKQKILEQQNAKMKLNISQKQEHNVRYSKFEFLNTRHRSLQIDRNIKKREKNYWMKIRESYFPKHRKSNSFSFVSGSQSPRKLGKAANKYKQRNGDTFREDVETLHVEKSAQQIRKLGNEYFNSVKHNKSNRKHMTIQIPKLPPKAEGEDVSFVLETFKKNDEKLFMKEQLLRNQNNKKSIGILGDHADILVKSIKEKIGFIQNL